jgi:O-acetyl-ADP-ribose deacetylase (regulator of RNase III)
MLERSGNIFEQSDADAICFTSNGILNKHGELVMGAGIAKAFKEKYPDLPKTAGSYVKEYGNVVFILRYVQKSNILYFTGDVPEHDRLYILNFPTKHHWKDPSDLKLIKKSALDLKDRADNAGWKKIYLTRPGCGLGGLDWEKEVKPVIKDILDDRFVVLTNE